MTEYLHKKQKATLAHRAYPQPLHRDPGEEVLWKYQISCQSKSQKANVEITVKNSYWESYMLMLLPEATTATLPLLTCDRCMPCNKE
jgi:hypothetical protein